MPTKPEPLIYRLRKRAEIRRQITTRKSVQEGKPDRIADLLEEAAGEISNLDQGLVTAFALLKQTSSELARHQYSLDSPACVNCGGESGRDVGQKCPYAHDYDLYQKTVHFLDNICLAYNTMEFTHNGK